MKRQMLGFVLLLFTFLYANAYGGSRKFEELDEALKSRDQYAHQKEARIDSLKRMAYPAMGAEALFHLYNAIYEEYHTYRFDSAMHYVDKAAEIARELANDAFLNRSIIHRSVLLSTSGYFSESVRNLRQIDSRTLDNALRIEYFTACEWAYSMWAEYSNDKVYAPGYFEKEMSYQDSLLHVLPTDSPFYFYWKAENLYRHHQYPDAELAYLKALEGTPINVRLYAMAAYGLALVYGKQGDWEKYETSLVKAAISDQVCPLKENLALQELAFYISKSDESEIERANRYLNYSMEDALFYNNRLRMLEIAKKFPTIVLAHQEQNLAKSRRLQISLVGISLLSIGLLISIGFIYYQVRQLRKGRKVLADMNSELKHLNEELLTTNHTREGYVSLFMELCAAYIEKLNRYQDLVKRKVKAKQTDDLLKMVNATRLTDTDAKEFFLSFDTAFLNLYPRFVEEFNELLREGEEIVPRRGELLNTELRIFALIRMGIKDSSKIATLLFYSPQTIYNRRSAVKNKAKEKEAFEQKVEALCEVMK